jgi:chromosome segregation protein
MKLRRLTLQGFKSFADRTELSFHDGITAIVGPNGCGKSNISDAIRWVLGEQRASAIRGAKMEEAIFQGTLQRRPLARAEVAMEFDNAAQRLALPQRDVEIRRIVYREGGSDYQLNRQSTRLRDILDVCRDTGLGANSYTVIEQGMIDRILSDRPDERRHMFEEAAAIGRYKDRRKAALRRLEGAEQDLARLEDLVGEVGTKVRSLARQRGRAERYQEYRRRRLDLEVAVARGELERVQMLLAQTAMHLEDLTRDEPAVRAALATAETELERRRLESTEAGRERNAVALRLEELNRMIAERERQLAVADERRAHAQRRIVQIGTERDELHARLGTLEAELASLEQERHGQAGIVDSLSSQVALVQERQGVLRQQVIDVRRIDEDARSRENELTRLLSRLDTDAATADARAADAQARIEQLETEKAELDYELTQLAEQGDLFAEQTRTLEERLETLRATRARAESALTDARAHELDARRSLAEAEDRSNQLTSRLGALETLDREYRGYAPAVAAAMTHRGDIEGLLGPVAEFLSLPPEKAAAVEGALGSLLQAVVVRDRAAVQATRRFIEERQGGGRADASRRPSGTDNPPSDVSGVVALLPESALPRLQELLDILEFAGTPPAEPVIVGRRERLDALRAEADTAARERDSRAAARDGATERVHGAEAALREATAQVERAELDLRRASADELTRSGRHGRVQRAREELHRRRQELEAIVERARSEAGAGRGQRAELEQQLAQHRIEWQHSTASLADKESAWEEVRDEEAELRVAHARAEGALTALDRRRVGARAEIEQAEQRLMALDTEEAEHRQTLTSMEDLRTGAGGELEELFRRRDGIAGELRALEDRLASAADAAIGLESQVRNLRRSSDERNELRHRLELQHQEADAGEQRVRERLEAEWGRPFEQLLASAAPVEDLPLETMKAELQSIVTDIERLGPINMLAVEEYDEESKRLEFLTAQRNDLVKARDDLQSAIREINKTARQLFLDTFEAVRVNFRITFQALFEGGECDIRLEDPDDPLESPIDISASPRGKRTQRIHLLSGGERALTALALLFAIYLVKPSPFCVLDEVDAPLDEANVLRFVQMLQTFKADTQFIVITHNPRTMEAADWLYGVTMEEAGVSSIVGVQLAEVLAGAAGNGGSVAG